MLNLKKTTKYLFRNPRQLFKNSFSDYKKDKSKIKLVFNKVWCIGLPKSGTTLIENILEQLPYVEMFSSVFRKWENTDPNYMFDLNVPEKLFLDMPNDKNTYFKTHTKYSDLTRDIIKKNKLRVIISIRDLRDMMISRYFHIMSYKMHWQHDLIKDLPFDEGFKISIVNKKKEHELNPLTYYYLWINQWIDYARKEKNTLVLNYEDYGKNKDNYISQILNYLKIDVNRFILKNFDNLKIKNSNSLSYNLKNYGREKSTFRSGRSEQWKTLFNEKTANFFNQNLPDSLEKLDFKIIKN
jgi:hypothetical protein